MGQQQISRRALLFTTPVLLAAQETSTVSSSPEHLRAAIREARPGARIRMADGIWNDLDLLFEAAGDASAPITLEAETPGKVVLTGASRLRIAGRHLIVSGLLFQDGAWDGDVISFRSTSTRLAHHCRVTECAIIDYQPVTEGRDTKWVSVYGYRNRVDHCYFAGKRHLGQTLVVWLPATGEPNRHWIDHNHFGPRPPLGVNGGETLRIGVSTTSLQSSQTLVESNLFDRCDGEIETISNKSCENIFRNNVLDSCQGTLTLRHGNRCLVDGNFFLGRGKSGAGGVRVIGEDHCVVNNYFADLPGTGYRSALCVMNGLPDSPLNGYYPVKRALLAYNLTTNCTQPLLIGAADSETLTIAPTDVTVAANLFHGPRAPLVTNHAPSGAVDFHHNHATLIDPLLEPGADGLREPSASSPLLKASPFETPEAALDIYGRPRRWPADIGCFHRTGDIPTTRTVPTDSNTGPEWKLTPQ
jgi:poly(beta-D-mannuronate) lyase